jgi:uncharacterized membrane-anchored protein
MTATPPESARALPPDDAQRAELHNEVHARPAARIRIPALVSLVAVLNREVSRADELAHLQRLPGQQHLELADLQANFLRLRLGGHTLKWERHTEFTRYSLVGPLPDGMGLGAANPDLEAALSIDAGWLAAIPGRTMAAIHLGMSHHAMDDPHAVLAQAKRWLGSDSVVASQLGGGHSLAFTDFRLRADGFERMLVVAPEDTSETRSGRISQRLLELEIYRLMALRGLPVTKLLAPMLADAEAGLAAITARLETRQDTEQALLDQLIHLAAGVERTTAEHMYRFAATQAYAELVRQRIAELRERPIPGTPTLGEFMQRRLSPAMATVAATAQRLGSLSQRIERTSALLRTRVDIATEAQNQQLLAKLTRGQALQLNLQTTVEGLSIAAISYYVISLVLYGAKALKGAGLPIQPEVMTGALIPLVLWVVWRATRRIHARLQDAPPNP